MTKDASPPSSGVFHAARRAHMADDVFDQIARAILTGEIAEGSVLPPERLLAERFGTSRIIARQAIHRLAELGLVRVRQGGATLVMDPAAAEDLRVLELWYKLAPEEGARAVDARQVRERQLHQGFSLVEVAERRATRGDREKIAAMTKAFAGTAVSEASLADFEERFWRAVASAGGNRIFLLEVSWWYRLLRANPAADRRAVTPLAERVSFYGELADRLRHGDGAADFYLATMRALLREPGSARRSPRALRAKRAAG